MSPSAPLTSRAPPRPYQRTTLRARHRPVVRGLAEAFFSADGEVEPAQLDAFVDEVDRFVSPASKTLRWGLLVMLDVVRWAPLFVLGRFSTFEGLPRADKTRMLEAMDRSKIAELTLIVVAYKTIMSILFFESAIELSALGYPGPERHRYRRGLPLTTPTTTATTTPTTTTTATATPTPTPTSTS